jgi:L-ascorbate metabolism protein UlaG (beta-lactamase superfamily)
LQDKTGPDGITVVCDPFDKKIGLKPPNVQADIVTVSHDHYDHNNIKTIRGKPYIISSAGEYDISGVQILGVQSWHDEKGGAERGKNIIYRIEIDNISISHLGDLGTKLDSKQQERLAGTDILLIPVGGNYTIGPKEAVEVVSQVEPRMVIPMHYKIPGLNVDISGVDKFIKELGLKPTEEEKLKISKRDLPQEDMELVMLKA